MTPVARPAQGFITSQPAHTDTMPAQHRVEQGRAHGERLTCQTTIDQLDQAPVAALEDLDDEENGEAAADAAEQRVDDGEGHGGSVLGVRDLGLGPAVEREEAEDEDEGAEADEGDRVAGQRVVLRRGVDIYYCLSYQCCQPSTSPLGPNRPILGPSMMAPTRAQVPPPRCTTPDPAKSWNELRMVMIRGLILYL